MRRIKEHKYFNLGVMIVTVVSISLFLLAIVLNLTAVGILLKKVKDVFSPLIIGMVLAYLMNPLMNFMERRLLPIMTRRSVPEQRARKLSRVLSLTFALLVMLVLIYEFCALLLPQLYNSIKNIVDNFTYYYVTVQTWVLSILADNPQLQKTVYDLVGEGMDLMRNWAADGLLPGLETVLTGVTTSVAAVVKAVINVLVGFFVAVYILYSRDTFLAQIKKIVVAIFKPGTANHLLLIGRRTHRVFYGFIIGKILDSMIIGILCYIGMLILQLPYPALVATVVGVTNVIPFFGPFIGGIPCAFLILLEDPLQAVYFALFILALQQLDGNVIGPRILGDTIGISGFWILVSITVAGGLFGFPGMLLGVPVFAVIYMLIRDFISSRLREKGKPLETTRYRDIKKVEHLDEET